MQPLEDVTNIGGTPTPTKTPEQPPPPPPPPLASEVPARTIDSVTQKLNTRLVHQYVHIAKEYGFLAKQAGLAPIAAVWSVYAIYMLTPLSFMFSALLWSGLLATFYHGARSAFGISPKARERTHAALVEPPALPSHGFSSSQRLYAAINELDVQELVPDVVWALNMAIALYGSVVEGHNPRAALGAAVAFWLVAQLTAIFTVPSLVFITANIGCTSHALLKHEVRSPWPPLEDPPKHCSLNPFAGPQ